MRIQIEDYFGSDVLKLDFSLLDREISYNQNRVDKIEEIANEYGYNVADIDIDSEGEFIRVQQVNIVDDEIEQREGNGKIALVNLVTNLSVLFL